MNLTIEVIGWLGATLILAAYALVSTDKLEPRSIAYQMLNIVGAACFVVNSGWNGAIPSAALNVVWIAIGLFVLLRRRTVRDV